MKKLTLIFSVLLIAGSTFAASDTWTGATDTDWNTADNWLGGEIPSGSSDIATFTGVPTANQPTLAASIGLGQIRFESAGWTVSGNGNNINFSGDGSLVAISSAGAGVNIYDATFSDQYITGLTIQAGTGNTLVMNQGITNRRGYTLAGEGTIVFNADFSGEQAWTLGAGTMLFNCPTNFRVGDGSVVSAGSTLGGTTSTFLIDDYSTLTLEDSAKLSIGGDGTYGSKIVSTTFQSDSATTVRAYVDMGGTSSELVMDIGTSLGDNDQIVLDLRTNGYFYLRDCVLALRADGAVEDGTYTLITETTGNYSGAFGAVTLNGETLDAARYTLTYNADSVTIDLNGIVPEPASMGLLAVGGLALLKRRRK